MKIINVRMILADENGLDIIKDMEEESNIKLIKLQKNRTHAQSIYDRNFGSTYGCGVSEYNFDCESVYASDTIYGFSRSVYNNGIYNSDYEYNLL